MAASRKNVRQGLADEYNVDIHDLLDQPLSPQSRNRVEIATADFKQSGFCIVPNLLPRERIQELAASLQRHSESLQRPLTSPEILCDGQTDDWLNSPESTYYATLHQLPEVQELASQLLGCFDGQHLIQHRATEYFCKAPSEEGKPSMPTPPHQDNFYFCFANPACLTIWVALDAVDAENGCMSYMQYSDKTGDHGNGERGLLEHEGSAPPPRPPVLPSSHRREGDQPYQTLNDPCL